MIGFIKKFLNSDFTKPLNTLIDEVKATLALIKAKTDTITADLFTATHASRIDATISSRALETTAQAIKAKTDTIQGKATNRTFYDYQLSTTTSSNNSKNYTTFKTITGTGRINYILFKYAGGSGVLQAKILIDGIVAFEGVITVESSTDVASGIALFSSLHPVTNGSNSAFVVAVPVSPQDVGFKYFPTTLGQPLRGRSWGTLISSGYSTGILFSNNPIEFKTSVVIQLANSNNSVGNTNIYSCYDLDY